MSIFDFLGGGGTALGADSYDPSAMQGYAQAANTGQGMNYQNVLAGGQASAATQGLDFSKIGQWALTQNQVAQGSQSATPSYQSALQLLGSNNKAGLLQPQAAGAHAAMPQARSMAGGHAAFQPLQATGMVSQAGQPITSLPVGLLNQNRGTY